MDSNFRFYSYLDDLKNTLHRHLTSASTASIFWPKFYFSWFYTDEKTIYNILNLKQRLGENVNQSDLDSYNLMRSVQSESLLLPTKVVYDDIILTRKKHKRYLFLSLLAGLIGKFHFKMSTLWLFTGFVPYLLLRFYDKRNPHYSEIENFYKYSLEIKKTKALYESQKNKIVEELNNYDEKYYKIIKDDLSDSQQTLFEVMNGVDRQLVDFLKQ